MPTPALAAGVDRLTRTGPLAPDKSKALTAAACRCGGARLVFAVAPEHCAKCGRDTRALSWRELAALTDGESYALLGAAVERARRDLDYLVQDMTGCDGFVELLRETYWLRDALRSGWVPE